MADCLRSWLKEEAEGAPILLECPPTDRENVCACEKKSADSEVFRAEIPGAVRRMMRQWGLKPYIPPPGEAGRDIPPLSPAELIERFAADDPDANGGTVPDVIAIAALERRLAELKEVSDAA